MKLATAAQMKELDRIAIEERGIGSLTLMEQAAQGVVKEILTLPVSHAGRQPAAIVFCGPGNNGGDGLVVARLLLEAWWRVKCVLVGSREKMTPDSREMERRLVAAGGVLEPFSPAESAQYRGFDVAVDALFGVGLNSELRPDAVAAVEHLNAADWTVSVDLPSGIHADTGEILGAAVTADMTVTFSLAKRGLFVGQGALCAGTVTIADIGLPADLLDQTETLARTGEKPHLPPRKADAHKGDHGKVLCLAGSRGYTGAPCLAARAAIRGGAGLVTVAVPEDIYPIVAGKCCDEAMVCPAPEDGRELMTRAKAADVLLVGPGLGQSPRAKKWVLDLLRETTCPLVLDADGLNILAQHLEVLENRAAPVILTPHDGEFARLTGVELPIVDRLGAAEEFVRRYPAATLILKGHRTIIATRDGRGQVRCVVNTTGNPGMAQGGSGDALAGLLAACLAQGERAVETAVWLHGRAGDLAAAEKGERGMSVGDLIEQIPYAIKECV